MRRILKVLKWFAVGIVGLIVVVVASASVYQQVAQARDLQRFPPPGQLVEVDGIGLHIHCQGEGSPTVVIEQGAGSPSVMWTEVAAQMAKTTRVCAYDRAGQGYSEASNQPATADVVVSHLHELLNKSAIDDDLVLVGWSAGGVYIREYFVRYPEKVKGMVLVDSSHEQQLSRLPPPPIEEPFNVYQILRYAAPLGLVRLSGVVERQVDQMPNTTPELKAQVSAIYNRSLFFSSILNEVEGFVDIELAANKDPRPLGDLPLTVTSQGEVMVLPPDAPPEFTVEFLEEMQTVWNELQEELTALSSRGHRIIATESGHAIHADQPELLVQAVVDMVELVRRTEQ